MTIYEIQCASKGWLDQIWWIFGKLPKGGGVTSDPKNFVVLFSLKEKGGSLHPEKFRCAFSVKKKGGVAAPQKISLQKAQHSFPKIGWGGGSEAVWKFSKNSSKMIHKVFPNQLFQIESNHSYFHLCWLPHLIILDLLTCSCSRHLIFTQWLVLTWVIPGFHQAKDFHSPQPHFHSAPSGHRASPGSLAS